MLLHSYVPRRLLKTGERDQQYIGKKLHCKACNCLFFTRSLLCGITMPMYIYFIKISAFQELTLRNTPVTLQLHENQHQDFLEAMSWNLNINECLVLLWLKEIQVLSAYLLNKIKAAYLKWSLVNNHVQSWNLVSVDKIFRMNSRSA